MALLKEFCAENMTLVPAAIKAGACRIELCDNLAVGGTTPSRGAIRAAVQYARPRGVAVMTMIRPRGGDFAYTAEELDIMRDDIDCACELDTTGVVFGCARDGRLDVDATEVLVAAARKAGERRGEHVSITFHMAFDAIEPEEQPAVIRQLADWGVDRILTHGGVAGTAIGDNLPRLRELVEIADGRITILPGAGITWENADHVAGSIGVLEAHGTKIVGL